MLHCYFFTTIRIWILVSEYIFVCCKGRINVHIFTLQAISSCFLVMMLLLYLLYHLLIHLLWSEGTSLAYSSTFFHVSLTSVNRLSSQYLNTHRQCSYWYLLFAKVGTSMIFLSTSGWISIIWSLFSFDSVHIIILAFSIRLFHSSILMVLSIPHKKDLSGRSPSLVSGKYSRRSGFSRTRSQMSFVENSL